MKKFFLSWTFLLTIPVFAWGWLPGAHAEMGMAGEGLCWILRDGGNFTEQDLFSAVAICSGNISICQNGVIRLTSRLVFQDLDEDGDLSEYEPWVTIGFGLVPQINQECLDRFPEEELYPNGQLDISLVGLGECPVVLRPGAKVRLKNLTLRVDNPRRAICDEDGNSLLSKSKGKSDAGRDSSNALIELDGVQIKKMLKKQDNVLEPVQGGIYAD